MPIRMSCPRGDSNLREGGAGTNLGAADGCTEGGIVSGGAGCSVGGNGRGAGGGGTGATGLAGMVTDWPGLSSGAGGLGGRTGGTAGGATRVGWVGVMIAGRSREAGGTRIDGL